MEAKDLAVLRGADGFGRALFCDLKKSLREEFAFEKRTRRPPKDDGERC